MVPVLPKLNGKTLKSKNRFHRFAQMDILLDRFYSHTSICSLSHTGSDVTFFNFFFLGYMLHIVFTCPCARMPLCSQRAFIHADEQRFCAIFRATIFAHHMCQLLFSKWPQITRGKASQESPRTNEPFPKERERER